MVTTIKKGTSREKIRIALKKRQVKIKSPDLKKYCGSISLTEDPMELQKKWRNEWLLRIATPSFVGLAMTVQVR